eukprot:3469986-Pleurochrysis_carterae.AAC.2
MEWKYSAKAKKRARIGAQGVQRKACALRVLALAPAWLVVLGDGRDAVEARELMDSLALLPGPANAPNEAREAEVNGAQTSTRWERLDSHRICVAYLDVV